METIKRRLRIPADHKVVLSLTVPESIPAGEAEAVVVISPVEGEAKDNRTEWLALAGCLRDSPAFQEDAVTLQRRWRDEWR